jgi:hypothetical protein
MTQLRVAMTKISMPGLILLLGTQIALAQAPTAAPPVAPSPTLPPPTVAPADATTPEPPIPTWDQTVGAKEKKNKKDKKDKAQGPIERQTQADEEQSKDIAKVVERLKGVSMSGRVLVQGTAFSDAETAWLSSLTLASARLGVGYQWRKSLKIGVSIDAGDKVKVRNAFVQVMASKRIAIKAGRFKLPIGEIARASTWDIPSVGRGGIAAILSDGLVLTGRRIGVMATVDLPGAPITVSTVFSQSEGNDGTSPLRPLSKGGGAAVALTIDAKLKKGVLVSGFVSNREVLYGAAINRYWASGLGAHIDQGRVQAWVDAIIGTSHFGAVSTTRAKSGFASGQAIVSVRAVGKQKKLHLSPYVNLGLLDPNFDVKNDFVLEGAGGLSLAHDDRWRVQVQVGYRKAQSARPSAIVGAGVDLNDNTSVSTQLGAAF